MNPIIKAIDGFVDHFTLFVSSRIQFFITICLTLIYMGWQLQSKHPLDDASAGFPKLILIYTLWFAWIEQIVRVAQRKMQDRDSEAMHRLHKLVEDSERRDLLLNDLLRENRILSAQILELVEIKDALKKVDDIEKMLRPYMPVTTQLLRKQNQKKRPDSP